MTETLKKATGVPYYRQLKDILKTKIQSGSLQDQKLPPVRETAHEWGVNPNTVLRAYQELAKEGIVSGTVGKGTFITTTPFGLRKQNRAELLRKAIEHALEEALSLDFTLEEFEAVTREYVRERLRVMHSVKLIFIECNVEQLTYFTSHLELDPHIQRIPILLHDLREKKREMLRQAKQADIIATSFYHLDEVREALDFLNKPIVGVNLEPEVRTLIEVAKIPSRSTVAIVTTSEQCRKEIREILDQSNIRFRKIVETNSADPKVIGKLVKNCRAALVSPRREEIVRSLVKPFVKVIQFVFTPDKTSINNLKVAILELKRKGA